jgi:hypothetical protein
MRKRREYIRTSDQSVDSIVVNLICVEDESPESLQRSSEVVELATEIIRLASKRGRVKNSEVVDEKPAA